MHGIATSACEPVPSGVACSRWGRGEVLLIFDGDCGFCTRVATWLGTVVAFRAAPWQSVDLGSYGISTAAAQLSVWLVDDGGVVASGAGAFSELLRHSPWRRWRVAGAVIGFPVLRALASGVYRLVARFRHRLPGGTAACALPIQHE